ncbi:MAG: hypothetical protein KF729_02930 [Sandaracinaceae bacterium]|nr:hypothetical protein [Sandaracinaceae bacterium]
MRYLTAMLVMLLANGCFFLPSWGGGWSGDDDGWRDVDGYHEVDGRIEQAWLGGSMRDLGAFQGDAYEASYVGGYGSSSVTLHAGERGGDDFGWAMLALSTSEEGGFEGEAFEPGSQLDTENGDSLGAVGCTGPSHGNWDFDGGADRVVVEVEEGPALNTRLIHFRAEFSGQGVTEGSFVLVIEAPSGSPGSGTVDRT